MCSTGVVAASQVIAWPPPGSSGDRPGGGSRGCRPDRLRGMAGLRCPVRRANVSDRSRGPGWTATGGRGDPLSGGGRGAPRPRRAARDNPAGCSTPVGRVGCRWGWWRRASVPRLRGTWNLAAQDPGTWFAGREDPRYGLAPRALVVQRPHPVVGECVDPQHLGSVAPQHLGMPGAVPMLSPHA